MVFKGRLFSSKKSSTTSSPDGSNNSPRSFGSSTGSPTGSDKKKVKSKPVSIDDTHVSSPSSSSSTSQKQDKKKIYEVKSVKLSNNSSIGTGTSKSKSPSLGNNSSGKGKLGSVQNVKNEVKTDLSSGKGKKGGEGLNTVSPILASSLGLNRIKTRSGPLPQESFFGFGSSNGRDGGSGIGVSNLSKGGKDVGRGKGDLRKKDLAVENVSFVGWADYGSGDSRDSMSTEGAASRDQSPHVQALSRLQNAKSSSSDAGTCIPYNYD